MQVLYLPLCAIIVNARIFLQIHQPFANKVITLMGLKHIPLLACELLNYAEPFLSYQIPQQKHNEKVLHVWAWCEPNSIVSFRITNQENFRRDFRLFWICFLSTSLMDNLKLLLCFLNILFELIIGNHFAYITLCQLWFTPSCFRFCLLSYDLLSLYFVCRFPTSCPCSISPSMSAWSTKQMSYE